MLLWSSGTTWRESALPSEERRFKQLMCEGQLFLEQRRAGGFPGLGCFPAAEDLTVPCYTLFCSRCAVHDWLLSAGPDAREGWRGLKSCCCGFPLLVQSSWPSPSMWLPKELLPFSIAGFRRSVFQVGNFSSARPTAGTRGTGNGAVGTPWAVTVGIAVLGFYGEHPGVSFATHGKILPSQLLAH